MNVITKDFNFEDLNEFIVYYSPRLCRIELANDNDMKEAYEYAIEKFSNRYPYGDIVPWNNGVLYSVKAENCGEAFKKFSNLFFGRK